MNDDMKKNWQDTNVNITDSRGSLDAIINGKRKTALQSLADRYKRFSAMGIILIMLSMSYIFNPNLFPGDLRSRIFLGLAFGLYALVASVMDHWLYNGIRGIDVVTMPVNEVIRKALFYRKRHLQFIAILLPVVLAIIGGMAWKMDNFYFLLGILAGFVGGSGVGIIQLMNFLADYRAITSDN